MPFIYHSLQTTHQQSCVGSCLFPGNANKEIERLLTAFSPPDHSYEKPFSEKAFTHMTPIPPYFFGHTYIRLLRYSVPWWRTPDVSPSSFWWTEVCRPNPEDQLLVSIMISIAAAFKPCLYLSSQTQKSKVAAGLYLVVFTFQRVTFTAGQNKGALPPRAP